MPREQEGPSTARQEEYDDGIIQRGGGTPPFVGMLDTLGLTAKLAYGLRKLRAAYAGSCMRVRRVSDSVELDIGFDSSGVLDWAAANAHKGGSSLTVKLWYDQSGSGINMDPLATSREPVLDTVSHLINFDGADDLLRASAVDLSATSAISFSWVGKFDALGIGARAVKVTDLGITNIAEIATDGTNILVIQNATGGANNKYGVGDVAAKVYNAVCDRTLAAAFDTKFYWNSTEQISTSSANDISGAFPASSLVSLGESLGSNIADITSYEFILFASAVGDASRTALVGDQRAFYGL